MSGRRRALIVANDTYEQEALRNLLGPAADAEALGRVLANPLIGDFAVQVVRNEHRHVIEGRIEDLFCESRPDDVLLVHFSGHGLKSDSGELFFAASNTRPDRLGSTAVSAEFVQRCMWASRSRSVVLLLDCCYAGAFSQGSRVRAAGNVNVLDSFPAAGPGGGRGRAVITASNAMEYAFEGDQLADDRHGRPSVFTTALVEGLTTGDADQDEDGWVSLDELYDYVFDKVREQNPHQTPSRQVEIEGVLYVARSRRQRIHPAAIPPDLQAALADPNMFARLGAVGELRLRLSSDNLPVAVGAYEALTELARADIRFVADPAEQAMSEAAVQPAPAELHFGRAVQGSAPPHQVVRLLGPPIARACVPRPSDAWIRVDQVADGLDISVDTASTGTLQGSLELKGPTGEAVITIQAELVSPQPDAPHPESPAVSAPSQREDHATPAPQTAPPASTPAQQPPVRMAMAFAGVGIALLAGVAYFISVLMNDVNGYPHAYLFLLQASNVIPIAVAMVALLRINRPVISGFLQGMYWISGAWLVGDIPLASVDHMYRDTGRALAGDYVGIAADVLGVCAVILLLVSWNQTGVRRRAWEPRTISVMLACGIGLSQAAQFIFYYTVYYSATDTVQFIAAIPVGVVLTWYASSLRAKPLGGALILGWVIVTGLSLAADMTYASWSHWTIGRYSAVFSCLLLAAVAILTIVYMRGPSELDPDLAPAGVSVPMTSSVGTTRPSTR